MPIYPREFTKEFIRSHFVSMTGCAEFLDVDKSTLSRVLSGKRSASGSFLNKVETKFKKHPTNLGIIFGKLEFSRKWIAK